MATGCGDPSTIKTEAEAAEAVEVTMAVMSDGLGTLTPGTSGSFDCPDGGTMFLSADVQNTESTSSGTVKSSFDDCQSAGLLINGTLTTEVRVTTEDEEVVMSGDLTYAGSVDGVCRYDVLVRQTTTVSEVSGSICGFDANTSSDSSELF